MEIVTEPIKELSISRFRRMAEVVDMDPVYQREGNVWTLSDRQKFIDSIINRFDIPKLYFESVRTERKNPDGFTYQYAVIDGKQRLETIMLFLSNNFELDKDIRLFEDRSVKLGGMRFGELDEKYPNLARRLTSYILPVVRVVSDSGDLVEEMFQRLNSSSSLNAAEQRNAISGQTRDSANRLAQHGLLEEKSPIKSARYKYRELAAKFLAIEYQFESRGDIADTKSKTLRDLFKATSVSHNRRYSITDTDMRKYESIVSDTLDKMYDVFEDNDRLLTSIGTVVVDYIAFRDADFSSEVSRDALVNFEDDRKKASAMLESDEEYSRAANARLRDYNAYIQSANDGKALMYRASVLKAYIRGYRNGNPLAALDGISNEDLSDVVDVGDVASRDED